MSEYIEETEQEYNIDESKVREPLPRKKDRRSETSKKNAAKAREAKLNTLKKKKEKQTYVLPDFDYSDSDSDSGSCEEQIYLKPVKSRKKVTKEDKIDLLKNPPKSNAEGKSIQDQINDIRNMLEKMSGEGKKTRSRKPRNKTVVQIVNPSVNPLSNRNPKVEGLKERMLLKF